uniref:Uncharacterized protein n=1 Tax=Schistocephalus solidus TaxID=70667 RepID=A0A0X3Q3P8_SCHSO
MVLTGHHSIIVYGQISAYSQWRLERYDPDDVSNEDLGPQRQRVGAALIGIGECIGYLQCKSLDLRAQRLLSPMGECLWRVVEMSEIYTVGLSIQRWNFATCIQTGKQPVQVSSGTTPHQ